MTSVVDYNCCLTFPAAVAMARPTVHVIIQLQRGQEIPATRNIDLGGIDVIVINILVAAHYL